MSIFNFKITISLNKPIPNPQPSEAEWFPFLSNIYGTKTRSFDGYVSSVEYLERSLVIYCYLVEDNDTIDKLAPFKKLYSNWLDYQKNCILDALNIHLRVLGYNSSNIDIYPF